MIPIPASHTHGAFRRGSMLLASCLARVAVAMVGVVAIWLTTAWALGWL